MENDPLKYEKFVFASLFGLANKLQVIGDQFWGEITTKQWFLLVMVANFEGGSPTLGQLAEMVGCSHQNAKQIALKLEQKGYLAIEKDQKDSRAIRFKITQKCLTYFEENNERSIQFLKELYKGLSEDEIKMLAKGLHKLSIKVSSMEGSIKTEELGWIKNMFSEE